MVLYNASAGGSQDGEVRILPRRWTRWVLLVLCSLMGVAGGLMAAAKSGDSRKWTAIPSQEMAVDVTGNAGSREFIAQRPEQVGPEASRLNIAAKDGDKIAGRPAAGGHGGESVPLSRSVESALQQGVIDINRATASEFETLPGIGPRLAERVVQLRREKGGFDSVDELLEVKGIGPSKLEKLRPLATVTAFRKEQVGG